MKRIVVELGYDKPNNQTWKKFIHSKKFSDSLRAAFKEVAKQDASYNVDTSALLKKMLEYLYSAGSFGLGKYLVVFTYEAKPCLEEKVLSFIFDEDKSGKNDEIFPLWKRDGGAQTPFQLTVKELREMLDEVIKDGKGDRPIYVASDEEGNSVRCLFNTNPKDIMIPKASWSDAYDFYFEDQELKDCGIKKSEVVKGIIVG